MAFIRTIHEDDAEGELFRVYDEIQRKRGRVSNVLRIQSLDPKGLSTHLDFYMTLIYGKGSLSRLERELLAVVVSHENRCEYCITHHGEALSKYQKEEGWLEELLANMDSISLTPRIRGLVDYAVGLTRNPGTGRKEAVEALRKAGLNDEEILRATEIVAYFNFVNRLVQGLGVELEDDDHRDYHY